MKNKNKHYSNSSLPHGTNVIKKHLETMPELSGVYRMLGKDKKPLYIGKAKNLKKRLTSYTKTDLLSARLQRMVSETYFVEIIVTHTEVEALLLESDLIKKLKPHFNILLKDDKTFPHILITDEDEWARIVKHRGAQTKKGTYFGPFASAGAVNRTISILQKAFQLRSCSDSIFAARTKPCMQYQIKRCSAPCAGYISHSKYIELVSQAKAFLSGQSSKIIKETATKMEKASKNLDFEKAAVFRDRINALRQIHGHKTPAQAENADVIAIHQTEGQSCIHIFFFRGGYSCGNCSFFLFQTKDANKNIILEAFVSQFYSRHTPPLEIILNISLPNQELVHKALEQKRGNKIKITVPIRGNKKKLVEQVLVNAKEALARRFADKATQKQLMNRVAETFGLPSIPNRIEVFDNSHIQGTNAVGCMIAAGIEGFIKSSYRKFNINNTVGDDYGMMREVFTRHFTKITNTPDIVLIDGGRGHLNVVLEVFAELGVENVTAIAISKGRDRNAGKEQFHCQNKETFSLPSDDAVLYFLQRLRDEAHRFAIGSHRAKRLKNISSSPLDNIPRIGAKRRKALLYYFGSAKAVSDAGIDDLNAVNGISKKIAKNIYDYFHYSG